MVRRAMVDARSGLGRRSALVSSLAAITAGVAARGFVPRFGAGGPGGTALQPRVAGELRTGLPWRLARNLIDSGRPNARLGLVQAQHIYGKTGAAGGYALVRAGLVRVRIPASLARQGDEGWRRDRFEDGWWMERLRDIGVPFKAVVELWPRFSDELHAEHAARVVRRVRPGTIIVGNEANVAASRSGTTDQIEIDRYLNQYAAIHAVVRAVGPETRLQLYGEAYDGEPSDPDAFLRRLLTELRRRALPPPDVAGIHIYNRADELPARVAGYRRLLADFGLRIALSIEELGPRQGVLDDWELSPLVRGRDPDAAHRHADLRATGWLTEEEQTGLVVQQLATAAACADQAQVFCAIDFDAEITHRRGLVSSYLDRARPALPAFRFIQRLLNDLESAQLATAEENGGVTRLIATRHDGLVATILWRPPLAERDEARPARPVEIPPYTFVCDARGDVLLEPAPYARPLDLPPPTTPEAGGAVRILV